ncbi:MAG: thiamine phosphate synthase [Candidatus Limimorpha sp.]
MLFIVVTNPFFIDNEHIVIRNLIDYGVDYVHVRKPEAKLFDYENLLSSLDEKTISHIVLHDFHELALHYPVHGIHLNRRNPSVPKGFTGNISYSAHSLDEVRRLPEDYEYCFLSPIYDSISKKGYNSAFKKEDLLEQNINRLINKRVIALGGITYEKIDELNDMHFLGFAMLGDIMNKVGDSDFEQYVKKIDRKRKALSTHNFFHDTDFNDTLGNRSKTSDHQA